VIAAILLAAGGVLSADEFESDLDYTQVSEVAVTREASGTWRFDVTVEHNDTGWDHYADAWQVLDERTGDVLRERTIHPQSVPGDNPRGCRDGPGSRPVQCARVRWVRNQEVEVVY
jgi:hypothetical protein